MSDQPLFLSLLAAAITVGPLHTIAPDHWAPFAAVARARGWSAMRTARVTVLCGIGHVTVSAALGLVGLFTGIELLLALGRRMESLAALLLIGFGLLYALWGLRTATRRGLHGHGGPLLHGHHHLTPRDPAHVHDPSRLTAWSLFLLFSADPCVAVIPLLFAAAPLGISRAFAVVLAYELSTIATMVALVLPARAGANALRARWLDRWSDVAAGGLIAGVGVLVSVAGW